MSNKHRVDIFTQMINSEAWKELVRWAEEEKERSMSAIDAIPAKDLSANHVCEERGVRKGIQKLINQAHYCAEGR